jgi:hypothetical protein
MCLLFELALRVIGIFRLFDLFHLIGWGKFSHALLYGYMLLEIIMAYFIVIVKIELSRGIGESFCLFYNGSLVSPRTPRSHELF